MNAAIFDIDGTIADCSHRRHFVEREKGKKDWKSFFAGMADDVPLNPVVTIMHGLANLGYAVILCSGRYETHRATTIAWLAKWKIHHDKLYMRPDGDSRADTIVKRELLDQILAAGYLPHVVVDDRNSVIAMWKEAGLTVLAVNGGYDF